MTSILQGSKVSHRGSDLLAAELWSEASVSVQFGSRVQAQSLILEAAYAQRWICYEATETYASGTLFCTSPFLGPGRTLGMDSHGHMLL